MAEDLVFGKEIVKTDLFSNSFDKEGEITLYEKGFKIKHNGKQSKCPYEYIKTIDGESVSLGKIRINMNVLDMLGVENTYTAAIPEQIYRVLKRRWEESIDE